MESLSLRVTRTETSAIHIEPHPYSVRQHDYEQKQHTGDSRQTSAQIEQQTETGDNLERRQKNSRRQKQKFRQQAIGSDQNRENLRLYNLQSARINKNSAKPPAYQPIEPTPHTRSHNLKP